MSCVHFYFSSNIINSQCRYIFFWRKMGTAQGFNKLIQEVLKLSESIIVVDTNKTVL